jgi:tetratricopeptide (TPR) repeat protein
MGKLATLLAAGVLICIGTLVSVLTVFNVEHQRDSSEALMEQLQQLKKQKISDNTNKQIADIAWQLNDLSTTEKILYDRWSKLSTDWNPSYAAEFSETALNLASVYMDHGAFLQALKIYDELLQRDTKIHGARSSEVARGMNNRALCLYLIGTTLSVPTDRRKYFDAAIRSIETSNSIWHQIKDAKAEFNVKNNDALAQLVQRDIAEP